MKPLKDERMVLLSQCHEKLPEDLPAEQAGNQVGFIVFKKKAFEKLLSNAQ